LLVIDLVSDLPLPVLEGQVPDEHKPKVDTQRHYGEGDLDLVVLLRL